MRHIIPLIIGLAALAATCFMPSPSYAYDPPEQTGNVTDVILWYGDNLTIQAGDIDVTVAELTEAAEAGAQVVADEIEAIWDNLFLLLLAGVITALAFTQRNIFLYCITVPVNVTYGLYLASGSTAGSVLWVEGLVIAIIGTFCLYRAVEMGLATAREKRGKAK